MTFRPDMQSFAELIRARSGLHIGQDKFYLVETRLAPIQRRLGLPSLGALIERVQAPKQSDLLQTVIEALTTNESLFFRDGRPFAHLRDVLPAVAATKPPGQPVRIWSAAASSGQEPYSIAMVVADVFRESRHGQTEILATDIARTQLDRARRGVYTAFEVQRGLPHDLLKKHFSKEGDDWRIDPTIRARVRFEEWNLLDDPGTLGRFDIVFCRNVLIYFDLPTKRLVFRQVARAMRPEAYLYLGGAETPVGISDRFTAIPGVRGVYGLTGDDGTRGSDPEHARLPCAESAI